MTSTTTREFVNHPLDTLYSSRIRLNPEERVLLKEAQNELRKNNKPADATPVMAGSSISVSTATNYAQDAYQAAGLSDLVLNDILSSRDTISLPVLLKVEALLGVKVVTRKRMLARFNDYLDYLDIN